MKIISMEESNIRFLSILHGISPSKVMCSKTQIERDMMEMILYTWLQDLSMEKI
jgi:hypothetical protein